MASPVSPDGGITAFLIALFVVAMNPPVVTAVGRRALVMGVSPLYLWFVAWGVFASVVLVWAAHQGAFALTNDQVPPELRDAGRNPSGASDDGDGGGAR